MTPNLLKQIPNVSKTCSVYLIYKFLVQLYGWFDRLRTEDFVKIFHKNISQFISNDGKKLLKVNYFKGKSNVEAEFFIIDPVHIELYWKLFNKYECKHKGTGRLWYQERNGKIWGQPLGKSWFSSKYTKIMAKALGHLNWNEWANHCICKSSATFMASQGASKVEESYVNKSSVNKLKFTQYLNNNNKLKNIPNSKVPATFSLLNQYHQHVHHLHLVHHFFQLIISVHQWHHYHQSPPIPSLPPVLPSLTRIITSLASEKKRSFDDLHHDKDPSSLIPNAKRQRMTFKNCTIHFSS